MPPGGTPDASITMPPDMGFCPFEFVAQPAELGSLSQSKIADTLSVPAFGPITEHHPFTYPLMNCFE